MHALHSALFVLRYHARDSLCRMVREVVTGCRKEVEVVTTWGMKGEGMATSRKHREVMTTYMMEGEMVTGCRKEGEVVASCQVRSQAFLAHYG